MFIESEKQSFSLDKSLGNVLFIHWSCLVLKSLYALLKYFGCVVLVFVLEDSSAGNDLLFTVL